MPTSHRLPLASALVCLALLAGCGTETSQDTGTNLTYLGQLPDFTLDDVDGNGFQLSSLDADRAEIERVLRAVGLEYGLTADMGLDTEWASLVGLQEDGEFDPWAKWKLLYKAGAQFGRVATEESLEDLQTLGDAVDWIERLNGQPVVFMTWSPRCKTCPQMNDRIHETLAPVDARLIVIASSFGDTPEMFAKYRELYDFHLRILADTEQEITDVLKAERTPTFHVIDGEGRLRYRGALDDDPMGLKDLEERTGYVADAVVAITRGDEVATPESTAPG